MNTAPESEQQYQAAWDASDNYLTSLKLHPLGDIEPGTRILLAGILMEELVQLEVDAQSKFREVRLDLFETINCGLNSFEPTTAEWPTASDLAEKLELIGCVYDSANVSLKRICKRLKGQI